MVAKDRTECLLARHVKCHMTNEMIVLIYSATFQVILIKKIRRKKRSCYNCLLSFPSKCFSYAEQFPLLHISAFHAHYFNSLILVYFMQL